MSTTVDSRVALQITIWLHPSQVVLLQRPQDGLRKFKMSLQVRNIYGIMKLQNIPTTQ